VQLAHGNADTDSGVTTTVKINAKMRYRSDGDDLRSISETGSRTSSSETVSSVLLLLPPATTRNADGTAKSDDRSSFSRFERSSRNSENKIHEEKKQCSRDRRAFCTTIMIARISPSRFIYAFCRAKIKSPFVDE
jgi:hypothetical protein